MLRLHIQSYESIRSSLFDVWAFVFAKKKMESDIPQRKEETRKVLDWNCKDNFDDDWKEMNISR